MQRAEQQATNPIEVTITTLGGTSQTLTMPANSSVADVLIAGSYPRDCEVRVNGETYHGNDLVDNGDRLVVVDSVKPKGGSYIDLSI